MAGTDPLPSARRPRGRRFGDPEDVMSKVRIIVLVAAVGLAARAAPVLANGRSQSSGFAPLQIDTLSLLSQAGPLPVEPAPEI